MRGVPRLRGLPGMPGTLGTLGTVPAGGDAPSARVACWRAAAAPRRPLLVGVVLLHALLLAGTWFASRALGDGEPGRPVAVLVAHLIAPAAERSPAAGPLPPRERAAPPPMPRLALPEPPPILPAQGPAPGPLPVVPTLATRADPGAAPEGGGAGPGADRGAAGTPTLPAGALVVAAAPPAPRSLPADHAGCARAPHPAVLRERGIEGLVRLRVQVGADGRARQVQVVEGSGWRLFDEAALAQARGCRYRPATEGDVAVESWVEFPVRFSLAPA